MDNGSNYVSHTHMRIQSFSIHESYIYKIILLKPSDNNLLL